MQQVAIASALFVANMTPARAESQLPPCSEDAMIVFDASGSMSGNVGLGMATAVTRIDEVRSALRQVLPSITRFHRVGLITYGPGPYQQCNTQLNLKPAPHAAEPIMREVDALTPAGKTPLTDAVRQAANVLEFRSKPGVIVVLTDGEETCGGEPCHLGEQLNAEADQLTVHVIGYRPKGFSWTGEQSVVDAKCLAEKTGGFYISAETKEELIAALEKTLGCPMVTEGPSRSVAR